MADVFSLAGVVGLPVYDGWGRRVGSLDDLVVRWDAGGAQPPPLHAASVRRVREHDTVPAGEIASIEPDAIPPQRVRTGSISRRLTVAPRKTSGSVDGSIRTKTPASSSRCAKSAPSTAAAAAATHAAALAAVDHLDQPGRRGLAHLHR